MEQLRKVQLLQLEILKEVDRICKKNNINYFLTGGTLLGAIRHKGFIPWDDDLDIGMTRENYDKFIEVAQNELLDKYFLQNGDTEKNFALMFSKIRINDTIYQEKNSKDVKIHQGIFIDIFPYDNKITDIDKLHKQNKRISFYRLMLLTKAKYNIYRTDNKIKKICYEIFKIMVKFISAKSLKNKLQKEATSYNNEKDSTEILNWSTSYTYDKEIMKKEWIQDYRYEEFEGEKFMVPLQAEKFLEQLYGDYMKLPPEDQRYNRHGIQKIDLGEYDKK